MSVGDALSFISNLVTSDKSAQTQAESTAATRDIAKWDIHNQNELQRKSFDFMDQQGHLDFDRQQIFNKNVYDRQLVYNKNLYERNLVQNKNQFDYSKDLAKIPEEAFEKEGLPGYLAYTGNNQSSSYQIPQTHFYMGNGSYGQQTGLQARQSYRGTYSQNLYGNASHLNGQVRQTPNWTTPFRSNDKQNAMLALSLFGGPITGALSKGLAGEAEAAGLKSGSLAATKPTQYSEAGLTNLGSKVRPSASQFSEETSLKSLMSPSTGPEIRPASGNTISHNYTSTPTRITHPQMTSAQAAAKSSGIPVSIKPGLLKSMSGGNRRPYGTVVSGVKPTLAQKPLQSSFLSESVV